MVHHQLISIEKEFPLKFGIIRNIIEQWKASRTELLNSARCNDGKIYAKAFPGRAAILVKLLNLTPNDIEAVFEKPNSQKKKQPCSAWSAVATRPTKKKFSKISAGHLLVVHLHLVHLLYASEVTKLN